MRPSTLDSRRPPIVHHIADAVKAHRFADADAALAFSNNPAPNAARYLNAPAGWSDFEREFLTSMAQRPREACLLSEKQIAIVGRLAEKFGRHMRGRR